MLKRWSRQWESPEFMHLVQDFSSLGTRVENTRKVILDLRELIRSYEARLHNAATRADAAYEKKKLPLFSNCVSKIALRNVRIGGVQ
jgi:hypothetical protein